MKECLRQVLEADDSDFAYALQGLLGLLDETQLRENVPEMFERALGLPDHAGDAETPRAIALLMLAPTSDFTSCGASQQCDPCAPSRFGKFGA